MANRSRKKPVEPPIQVPIWIPTEDGAGELALGLGEIRGSTLILNFNDLYPSQAILHRMQRGGIIGITFVIPAEEGEEHAANEAAIQAAQDERRAREADEAKVAKDLADLDILDTSDVPAEQLGN